MNYVLRSVRERYNSVVDVYNITMAQLNNVITFNVIEGGA